jgi:diguanylate cyclase (GGDEF)-like protein
VSRLHRFFFVAIAVLSMGGLGDKALSQDSVEPYPKPAEVAPDAPVPRAIIVPGGPESEAAPQVVSDPLPPFRRPVETLPQGRSGLGGVIVDPVPSAVDITAAVSRRLSDDGGPDNPSSATYMVDFVNPLPAAQTRILVLDAGTFGGQGAARGLALPHLVKVLTSTSDADIDILETGPRTRVRLVIPGEQSITAAFRYAAPLNSLTVEMWGERALARFDNAALVMQGALLGLVIALGAWLAGMAILRRDRISGWLAALFAAAFLALLAGFGFTGGIAIAGVVTGAGLALGLLAGCSALALAFTVQVLAPDGRWRAFAPFAHYAPWLIAASGLMAMFNAPYAAVVAKSAAIGGLGLVIGVIFARAWEGDGAARRLTLAAIFLLLALAPLSMLEVIPASGRITMLAAAALMIAALLMASFAVSASTSPVLRQRVDRLVASSSPREAAPPPFAPAPPIPLAPVDEGRYTLALAAAHQGLFDWDLKRDRLFLSPSVEALLGARPGQLQSPERSWRGHVHDEDLETFLGALEDYRRIADVSFVLDFRGRGLDGVDRWLQLRASFMSDGERAARCIGLVSDVSAQKESEALLLASARQDATTGLANRAFFLEALTHRLTFAAPDRAYALLTIDIARFRTVNESLGHAAGDALLAAIADRIRASAPETALIARLGGDVFVLLWPSSDADQAGEAAKSVLDTVAVPIETSGRRLSPVVRGGLAMLDGTHSDAASALSDAEIALAASRKDGGSSLTFFVAAMREVKSDRAALERDLAGALERNEILVHYQPIVRVADRSPAGFEALVRWRHPQRGLLNAEAFAGLAEETGHIEALGRFVLETASRDAARWRLMAPRTPPIFVNINVSAHQLASPAFITLCEKLSASGLSGEGIRLEITETLAIDDTGAAVRALQRLRAAGFGLVMDDFGSGHSTPSRLAHLPFDAVKIDRSFMSGGGPVRNVLAGLLRLARDLDLEATAEGVESEEDLAFLAANRCTYAQGYFCGMPRDAAATQAIILDAVITAEAGE